MPAPKMAAAARGVLGSSMQKKLAAESLPAATIKNAVQQVLPAALIIDQCWEEVELEVGRLTHT